LVTSNKNADYIVKVVADLVKDAPPTINKENKENIEQVINTNKIVEEKPHTEEVNTTTASPVTV